MLTSSGAVDEETAINMSGSEGGFCVEKMQELQRQLNSMMKTINTNSKVLAFMSSPYGRYLDEHPYVALSLLVFIALSAVPVGLFLTVIVTTAVTAFLGVIIVEGIVIVAGGIALLCVLCGLVILSFGISGVLSVCYFATSSILNYMHTSRLSRSDSGQSQRRVQMDEVQNTEQASKDESHTD